MSKTERKNAENADIFFCEKCDFKCFKKSNYTSHLSTRKHTKNDKMSQMERKNAENAVIFFCEKCDFKCFKNSNYTSHLTTRKHQLAGKMPKNAEKCRMVNYDNNLNENKYQCETCNKIYKHNKNLLRHQSTCKTDNKSISTGLILEILNENKELKELLIEQNKITQEQNKALFELSAEQNKTIIELSKNNQIVNSTVNSNNKVFNLQLFLNETCKDAMNIKDFVHSIQLQLTDLENVGHVGFVNGITKIIVKNLKSLKQENRPVHCTDEKRKIIYIKDSNKWEKEDDTHKKVRNAIKHIARNNFQLMYEFKKMYPCCVNSDSRYNNMYLQLMNESLGGSGNSDSDNETKIITNISKEILIEK
jgi:hypothetical protein